MEVCAASESQRECLAELTWVRSQLLRFVCCLAEDETDSINRHSNQLLEDGSSPVFTFSSQWARSPFSPEATTTWVPE